MNFVYVVHGRKTDSLGRVVIFVEGVYKNQQDAVWAYDTMVEEYKDDPTFDACVTCSKFIGGYFL